MAQGRRALLELEADIAAWDTPQIVDHFRRLADLGDRGTMVVVTALNARTENVAQAAERVLNERIDTAALMKPQAAQRRLTRLAQALEAKAPLFDPPAQRRAADLATRLLLWPSSEQSGPEARQMIASCERLLRTIAAATAESQSENTTQRTRFTSRTGPNAKGREPPNPGRRPTAEALAAEPAHAPDDEPPDRRRVRPLTPDKMALALPGGGLPVEPLAADSSDTWLANRRDARQQPHAARSSPQTTGPRREGEANQLADGGDGQRFAEPRRLPSGDADVRRLPSEARRPGGALAQQDSRQPPAGQRMDNDQQGRGPDGGKQRHSGAGRGHLGHGQQVATAELMRLFRADDPTTAAWARQELTARGFTAQHLTLLEHLTSPDRQTRIEWARRLPTIPGIDAKRWLLWLSEDADARVRHTAIGLLATTDDPQMLRRLANMALRDNDPLVRRQGQQIQQRLDGQTVTASAVESRR